MKHKYFFISLILLAGMAYWFVHTGQTKQQPVLQQNSLAANDTAQALAAGIEIGTTTTSQIAATTTIPSPTPTTASTEYVVQSGDTISSIAQKYNIPANSILSINGLEATSLLKLKQKLTIPPADYQVPISASATKSVTVKPIVISTKSTKPVIKKTTKAPIKKTTVTSGKASGVTWTASALSQLNKVPSFVRSVVKSKINNYAAKHGIHVITPSVYKSIKV